MAATFSWSTTNTKEAACFAALGFVVSLDDSAAVQNDELTGQEMVQWVLQDKNPVSAFMRLDPVIKAWKSGSLHPLHPLRVGWRACQNYGALLSAQATGQRYRLRLLEGSQIFEAEPGQENPSMLLSAERVELSDLSLAAALSVVGVPVINIVGQPGARTYVLPRFGHPRLVNAEWRTEDVSIIARRITPQRHQQLLAAGKRAERYDLDLEHDDPEHPLVAAYNALHCWSHLRLMLAKTRKRLVLEWPKHTQRRAVISEAASPRVMDRLRAHLRLPRTIR